MANIFRSEKTFAFPFALVIVILGCSKIVTLDVTIIACYVISMIVSFACRDTERIFNEQKPKKLRLSTGLLKKSLTKLRILDAASDIYDLRVPPSNRLEALKGDRTGQFSIRINLQWRICFRFEDGQASDVIIIDYH